MESFGLLAVGTHASWYFLPLALTVSLVYSATRFEYPPQILRRSVRLFLTIVLSMGVLFGILFLLSWNL
jgi:hypothetical protein